MYLRYHCWSELNIQIIKRESQGPSEVVKLYCAAGSWITDWTADGKIKYVKLPTIGGVVASNIRYQFWNWNLFAIDVVIQQKVI